MSGTSGKESRKKVISRTECALAKPARPIVTKRSIEVWVLNGDYATNDFPGEERLFVNNADDALSLEDGNGSGENEAYDVAAHILLSEEHHLWYNARGKEAEYFERLKGRLARWLKWHDQIRKEYAS